MAPLIERGRAMGRHRWIKDAVIQTLFILLAVVATVSVAYTSLSDQYAAYYESKLLEKTRGLAYGASVMLANHGALIGSPEMGAILGLAQPSFMARPVHFWRNSALTHLTTFPL
jgi:ABC-type Fe3+ transport system permease subunit